MPSSEKSYPPESTYNENLEQTEQKPGPIITALFRRRTSILTYGFLTSAAALTLLDGLAAWQLSRYTIQQDPTNFVPPLIAGAAAISNLATKGLESKHIQEVTKGVLGENLGDTLGRLVATTIFATIPSMFITAEGWITLKAIEQTFSTTPHWAQIFAAYTLTVSDDVLWKVAFETLKHKGTDKLPLALKNALSKAMLPTIYKIASLWLGFKIIENWEAIKPIAINALTLTGELSLLLLTLRGAYAFLKTYSQEFPELAANLRNKITTIKEDLEQIVNNIKAAVKNLKVPDTTTNEQHTLTEKIEMGDTTITIHFTKGALQLLEKNSIQINEFMQFLRKQLQSTGSIEQLPEEITINSKKAEKIIKLVKQEPQGKPNFH